MSDADRVSTDEDGMVIACPECDAAGDVYRRHRHNTHIGDPDDEYACGKCSATFEEPVKREHKKKGTDAKYANLDPEDLGLAGGAR